MEELDVGLGSTYVTCEISCPPCSLLLLLISLLFSILHHRGIRKKNEFDFFSQRCCIKHIFMNGFLF